MFDTWLKLNLHSFLHINVKTVDQTRPPDNIINIVGPNTNVQVKVFAMSVIINAQLISVSDKSVSLGISCINTPTLWIGDISEAPNRLYIDITINDDGPSILIILYWESFKIRLKTFLRSYEYQ